MVASTKAGHAKWRAIFDANVEQAERLQGPAAADFWDDWVETFSPGTEPPADFPVIAALLRPEDTLLDVGAGAGRVTAWLAREVQAVRAFDPSPAMAEGLRRLAGTANNIDVLDIIDWPPIAPLGQSDVVFASHVTYFVREIDAFLDAFEAHATRRCIIVAHEHGGGAPPHGLFELLHGEPYAGTPGLHALVEVLGARGADVDVQRVPVPEHLADISLGEMRRRCAVNEGSAMDQVLQNEMAGPGADRWQGETGPQALGVVSWDPRVG